MRPFLASPIRYEQLPDDQLEASVIVAAVLLGAMLLLGLVALVRYRRSHRETQRGPAPWTLVLLVVFLGGVIGGLFAWQERPAPSPAPAVGAP
jgi:uncharacterized membrane protein YfcA